MQLKEVRERYEHLNRQTVRTTLGDIQVMSPSSAMTGTRLVVDQDGEECSLSAPNSKRFLRFLGIPPKFWEELPANIRSDVLRVYLEKYEEAPVVLDVINGEFSNIFPEGTNLVPGERILAMAERVFDPSVEVAEFRFDSPAYTLSLVTTDLEVQPRPGDITRGGVRFYNDNKNVAPSVSPFMERLVCRNGMTATSEIGQINLRGKTVDDIIQEMEIAAQQILGNMPSILDSWASLTGVTVDNVEQYLHRLSKEQHLSARLESRLLEHSAALEDNTMYSVVNMITQFQHSEGLRDSQRYALQELGGSIISDHNANRCGTCFHRLDG